MSGALRNSLWVYPWDILDDPRAVEEIVSLDLGRVSLAAVYHTTRTLLPHNPRRKVVSTGSAAAYFKPDATRYRGLRLQPRPATWLPVDSFGSALQDLRRAGLVVNAWIVVLHNSRLGRENRDLVVENAFGDHYEHALCPAQPEVRHYARALVGDVVAQHPLAALELEACGYMGWEHLSHHEKFGLRVDLLHGFLLSICFCAACQVAMVREDCDPRRLRDAITAGLESFFGGVSEAADDPDRVRDRLTALLGETTLAALVRARDGVTADLLAGIRAALPDPAPDLILSAGSSEFATGACVGLSGPALAAVADTVLVALFGLDDDTATRQVERLARWRPVLAGVRAFWPDAPNQEALVRRVERLARAGADGVHFYQYGLCPRPNLAWIRESQRPLADSEVATTRGGQA